MNVRISGMDRAAAQTGDTATVLKGRPDRKCLMCTAVDGTMYVNFSCDTPSASDFDVKLTAGQTFTFENYIGCATLDQNGHFSQFC